MNLETSGMNPEQLSEEGVDKNPEKVTEVTGQIREVLDDFTKETIEFLSQNREVSTATDQNLEHIVDQYRKKAMEKIERIVSRELN